MSQRRRSGFTLVELLVVTVMLGVLVGAIAELTLHQRRFHQAVAQRLSVRRAVYEGAEMLSGELRVLAPSRGGIYSLSPNRVDYRALIGASVVCSIDTARTGIGIPARGAVPSSLTSWIAAPQTGDTVLVYNTALSPDSTHWETHVLAAAPAPGGICPVSSGFSVTPENAASSLRLALTPPLAPNVGPGAGVRFVRAARYQLYRAGDGLWYLGYTDCLATRATPCATIQPVSGPYAANGVRFSLRDSTGAETSDSARFAWLSLTVRALARFPSRAQGYTPGLFSDSLVFAIKPRN